MKLVREPLEKAIAAAATLHGKSLALLIASSLVATTGIVAAGMSGSSGIGSLAAAAGLLSEPAPIASAPAPSPAETGPASEPSSPEGAPSAGAAPSAPLPAPAPSAPEPAPAPEPEAPFEPPAEPEPPSGPVQHVFLISLASSGYDAAWSETASQMPYLAGDLRPQGVLLSNYSLLDEAPLPNGIAAISGQPPKAETKAGCPRYEECVYEVETLTLADQLVGSRRFWQGYMEGMQDEEGKPDSCVQPEPEAAVAPAPSGYSAHLNPFVFFHSLLDLGDCNENDVPLDELDKDLKKLESTANLSYISPNLCNAGFHGTCPEGAPEGAAASDAFLAKVVPEVLASPAYKKDGLLIVSFGASDPPPPLDPAAPPVEDPLKVGALLVSPLLSPGATDAAPYNPYSLLRSTEELFGLELLGEAGKTKVRSFATAFTATNTGD